MWNDNYDVKITARNPAQIKQNIDEMVDMIGGHDAAIAAFDGVDPYAPSQPVCGNSANNLFKLFTEKSEAIDPTKQPFHDNSTFANHLDQLDSKKNHVMMINDDRLGHKYLVDLPASHGGPQKAYILQSDLGDGALPPLKIDDWIRKRGTQSVSTQDLKKLIGPELSHMKPEAQHDLLTSTLEVNQDPARVDVSKLKQNKPCTFACSEYDFNAFRRNAKYVSDLSRRSPASSKPTSNLAGA